MKLSFQPYELRLKHTFKLATSQRDTTPVMLTRIEHEGVVGYGEASMPPYLGESQATVAEFLKKVDLAQFNDPFRLDEILEYVDALAPDNRAAKASVDIALHDLVGKLLGQPLYKIWGFSPENIPATSYTIAIGTDDEVRQRVLEVKDDYQILKIKLGRDNDRDMIRAIRSVTDLPLCIDANQGWTDRHAALDQLHWLHEQNVVFAEQPMPKQQLDDIAWLTQHSPMPTIADESCQRLADVKRLHGAFTGINIKLMKSTGLREAHKMLTLARALDMRVMIGCMTETSCAVTAAAHLAPLTDWADLDGHVLISNDIYSGLQIRQGRIHLPTEPGLGITARVGQPVLF